MITCQARGMENATVNRDCAAVKKAFSLAYKSTPRNIGSMPIFPAKLEESARTDFLSCQTSTSCMLVGEDSGLTPMLAAA